MRVAKEKLLLIAGFVWLAAGLNIAILGVSAFTEMGEHAMLVLVPAAIVAFTVFHAGMFSKLVGKHADRIEAMEEARVPFWKFFDAKGYLIMAFMMTMGIGLRSSGIAHVVHCILLCGSWHCAGSFWLLLLGSLFPRRRCFLPLGAPHG